MAFTVPVTLTQTGLVSPNTSVSKTTSISQEVVTQIQVVVTSGATEEPINLNINDVSKVKLLSISVTGPSTTGTYPISYKFDWTGDDGWLYELTNMLVLFSDSLRIYDNDLSSTSNELVTMYVNNPNAVAVTVNVVIVSSND